MCFMYQLTGDVLLILIYQYKFPLLQSAVNLSVSIWEIIAGLLFI